MIQIYGLTETAPAISICEPLPEHDALGRPTAPASRRARAWSSSPPASFASSTKRAAKCPHDGTSAGEIVARGNVIMAGYYDDPDATTRCMGDGWFHTGDAAVVHPTATCRSPIG